MRSSLTRNAQGEKFCKWGDHWVPESAFTFHKNTADKLNNVCNPCTNIRTRNRTYNITTEQYDAMFAAQDFACAICKRTEFVRGRNWAVDHDHTCCPGLRSCGKCVRGILCGNCNTGLGAFEDSPEYMLAAIAYLEGRTV